MMNIEDDSLPQETLDEILARALAIPPEPGDQRTFFVHRIICRQARVSDLPVNSSTSVSTSVTVRDEIVERDAELGELISAHEVGPFTVRLVRGSEDAADIWQIVEANSRSGGIVILTYGSGDRAHEAATRYATDATEVDLTSDLDPGAHYFGEHRLPRST